MKPFFAFVVFCFTLGTLVGGCASFFSETDKKAAAESAYLAEHLRCVDTYNTRAQIDACRAAVQVRWGITVTSRDGGGDR